MRWHLALVVALDVIPSAASAQSVPPEPDSDAQRAMGASIDAARRADRVGAGDRERRPPDAEGQRAALDRQIAALEAQRAVGAYAGGTTLALGGLALGGLALGLGFVASGAPAPSYDPWGLFLSSELGLGLGMAVAGFAGAALLVAGSMWLFHTIEADLDRGSRARTLRRRRERARIGLGATAGGVGLVVGASF